MIKDRTACVYCKFCKIEKIPDIPFADYFCTKKISYTSKVTGEKLYEYCNDSMRRNCNDFKPDLITKILNWLKL